MTKIDFPQRVAEWLVVVQKAWQTWVCAFVFVCARVCVCVRVVLHRRSRLCTPSVSDSCVCSSDWRESCAWATATRCCTHTHTHTKWGICHDLIMCTHSFERLQTCCTAVHAKAGNTQVSCNVLKFYSHTEFILHKKSRRRRKEKKTHQMRTG